jgi:hypothetical protein
MVLDSPPLAGLRSRLDGLQTQGFRRLSQVPVTVQKRGAIEARRCGDQEVGGGHEDPPSSESPGQAASLFTRPVHRQTKETPQPAL